MLKRIALFIAFSSVSLFAQTATLTPIGGWTLCPIMANSPWCPSEEGSETFVLDIKSSSRLPVAFWYAIEGIAIDGTARRFSGIAARTDEAGGPVFTVLKTGILHSVRISIKELTVTGEWSTR